MPQHLDLPKYDKYALVLFSPTTKEVVVMVDEFNERQRHRIERRIRYCREVVMSGKPHAAFKARCVLPSLYLALIRLNDGTYGTCLDCGKSIPRARLEEVPAAVRCITCQRKAEAT